MNQIPIACQLWSFHDEWATHPLEVLKFLKESGYTGVELYGNCYSPEFTAALLKEAGMICAGWHSAIEEFEGDNFNKTLDKALTVGARSMCIAWYGTDSAAKWKEFAERLSAVSAKLAPYGIRTGFHSHASEFTPVDGQIPWAIVAENSDPSVVLQMDMGNTMAGGADALAWLKKYSGRNQLIHCKPWSKAGGYDLLKGDEVPWRETIDWCLTEGKTEWFIVEYEEANELKACIKRMHDMLVDLQK